MSLDINHELGLANINADMRRVLCHLHVPSLLVRGCIPERLFGLEKTAAGAVLPDLLKPTHRQL